MLVGLSERITADTGAYASLGGPVLHRAVTHAGGPYGYPNIDVEGVAVHTNNPPLPRARTRDADLPGRTSAYCQLKLRTRPRPFASRTRTGREIQHDGGVPGVNALADHVHRIPVIEVEGRRHGKPLLDGAGNAGH